MDTFKFILYSTKTLVIHKYLNIPAVRTARAQCDACIMDDPSAVSGKGK